jgi:predicted HD superfamily hydrolase involved in NAD metabolism
MTKPANSPLARYTPDFEAQVRAWAEAQIKPKRFKHVCGVVDVVDRLARRYAPDEVMRARLAGWVHDAAKRLPDEELLRIAEARGLPIAESERLVPMLLHGAVGYVLADEVFDLHDPALQSACAYHTTGAEEMTALDKIVYLGDLIEAGRDFPGVDDLRAEAERDLDSALLLAIDHTLRYLIMRGQYIDPRPVFLRNRLILAGVRYAKRESSG